MTKHFESVLSSLQTNCDQNIYELNLAIIPLEEIDSRLSSS